MKKFILYSCCITCRGFIQSTIIDVQRQNVYCISNDMFDFITDLKSSNIKTLRHKYKSTDTYIKYLESKELGFWAENSQCFPNINLAYNSPYLISNAILVITEKSNHDYHKIYTSLKKVFCQALEIRILYKIPNEKLIEILSLQEQVQTSLYSVTLVLPFSAIEDKAINAMVNSYHRITSLYIYASPYDYEYKIGNVVISMTSKLHLECGNITKKNFSPNLKMCIDSYNRNNCLNEKICIDYDGTIRNCPSMNIGYGNIATEDLRNVLKRKDFLSFWHLTKNEIKVCKDCEFRLICPDCRAFIFNQKDLLSHPLKCKYNPYLAIWEGEKGFHSIEQTKR